jgi:hypothetical protein
MAAPFSSRPYFGGFGTGEINPLQPAPDDQDPHLRSFSEVSDYHIHANDGNIGHIEDLVIEDEGWGIRYLVVDTRNWWVGQHVLVSPYAVREISWGDRQIQLDISREQIRSSPPRQTFDAVDKDYEMRLHRHFGWPGYGW